MEGIWMSELPESFFVTAKNSINSYSTGLIKIPSPSEDIDLPHLIGSGTFVQIGSIRGILTAQHVMKRLNSDSQLGLVLVEEVHRISADYADLRLEEIAQPLYEGLGPDLGFILLPSRLIKTIQGFQFKYFFDLAHYRKYMLISPPKPESGIWFVNGIPEILTRLDPSEGGFDQALALNGLCGAGGADQFSFDAGFDYVDVIVRYDENPGLPESFGGISGGGLWFVSVVAKNSNITPGRPVFVGMPISETEYIVDGKRRILCHGRRSIYERCFEHILNRFS